jgi:hypothetical protein
MQSDLRQWIAELDRGECPFAKRAWDEGRVSLYSVGSNPLDEILALALSDFDRGRIILLAFDPEKLALATVEDAVADANEILTGCLVLFTHPHDSDPSHPTFGLIFIQHKSEMMQAAGLLARTGYYDTRQYPEWYTA